MEIDGVEVFEQPEEYGYSWHWDDPRGFQSEILWKREVGHLDLGTRVMPGGWTHNTMSIGEVRTVYEAREAVEQYVSRAAAKP